MPQPLALQRSEVRNMPLQTRQAPIGAVDEQARTFRFVWTSGARVKRFDWASWSYYWEELSLDPAHVRLDRLKAGAPLLNSHQQWDLSSVLGVHEDAWLNADNGEATARFSDRDDKVNAYWRDVVNGILRNTSVGYIVHRYLKLDPEVDGGYPVWQAIDWEPVENSLVPIGADPLAGLRSLGEGAERPDPEQLLSQAAHLVGGRTFPCEFVTRVPEAPQAAAPAAAQEPVAASRGESFQPEEDPMKKFRRTPVAQAAETVTSTGTGGSTPSTSTTATEQPAGDQRSAEQIRAEERTRINGINAAAAAFRRSAHGAAVTDADITSMIERGITIDAARAEMFARFETASNSTGPTRSAANIQTTQDEQVQRRADMAAAVSHRANPSLTLPETARRFRGYTLFELARRSLELQGVNTEGMGRNAIVALAMGNSDEMGFRSMHGTGDFAVALASTVNRTLRDAYTSANQTFRAWARKGTLSDFRAATRAAVAGNLALEKVNEFGEFKRGKISDAGETIQLATYGKVVGVTRQVVINDDLDFLRRLPQMYGRAAADFESDTVYAIIKGNPVMADGVALFHANHGNLGTGAGITETALDEATQGMRKQKDFSGNNQPLNLVAKTLIVSSARELQARKLLSALLVATKSADVNVFSNAYDLVVEPRLDAVNPLEWFLAADPAQIDTVEYAYLEGEEGLYTEQRMGFDVDGLEVKARLDFAAKCIDHRGLWKNPGA